MSLYQMWQMDRMPDYALVNDAVELAKRELVKGIDGLSMESSGALTRTRPWNHGKFLEDAPKWIKYRCQNGYGTVGLTLWRKGDRGFRFVAESTASGCRSP